MYASGNATKPLPILGPFHVVLWDHHKHAFKLELTCNSQLNANHGCTVDDLPSTPFGGNNHLRCLRLRLAPRDPGLSHNLKALYDEGRLSSEELASGRAKFLSAPVAPAVVQPSAFALSSRCSRPCSQPWQMRKRTWLGLGWPTKSSVRRAWAVMLAPAPNEA